MKREVLYLRSYRPPAAKRRIASKVSALRSCSIRQAFFQVNTISSTTGFSTVNFDDWPTLSRMIMVLLMFSGACAGSTAGGL